MMKYRIFINLSITYILLSIIQHTLIVSLFSLMTFNDNLCAWIYCSPSHVCARVLINLFMTFAIGSQTYVCTYIWAHSHLAVVMHYIHIYLYTYSHYKCAMIIFCIRNILHFWRIVQTLQHNNSESLWRLQLYALIRTHKTLFYVVSRRFYRYRRVQLKSFVHILFFTFLNCECFAQWRPYYGYKKAKTAKGLWEKGEFLVIVWWCIQFTLVFGLK